MKAGLWVLTVAVIVMWTVAMSMLAQLLPWLAAQLPQWVGAMPDLSSWPWPHWLAWWVDSGFLQALQGMLQWLVELLRPLAPLVENLGSLLGWAVWLIWGMGLLLTLGLAVLAHGWIARRQAV